MPAVTRRTPTLDGLARWVKELHGNYRVEVAIPDGEQAKLAYLAARRRDLLAITPALTRAIASAIQNDARKLITSGGNLRTEATMRVVGEVVKAAVLGRVRSQGGDVSLAPLSAAYLHWKLVHRLDPRIAVSTGRLLRALRSAAFTLRRR